MVERKPKPETIRQILENSSQPLVFHGLLSSWSLTHFSQAQWNELLGNRLLECRVGAQRADVNCRPQWERHCDTVRCTYAELQRWTSQEAEPIGEGTEVLKNLRPTDHFLYFDYKNMRDIFDTDVLNKVDWSPAGFAGRDGGQSTFWLGTTGAHTPCHFDTYGYNLVGQVMGSKRWIMYPPEDAAELRPTRVPYEESSVYSDWDFRPWADQAAQIPPIRGTHPYVVNLKPGDVLLVPRHWWHFVVNNELSISINTWLEHPDDDLARLEEGLVKFLMTNVTRNLAPALVDELLNPNEEETPYIELDEIQGYIAQSLEASKAGKATIDCSRVSVHQLIADCGNWVSRVKCHSVPLLEQSCDVTEKPSTDRGGADLLKIVRAFSDPRVIRTVAQLLQKE